MSDVYNGKPLPSGWQVYTTEDDRPYFHHRATAATQWDVPTGASSGFSSGAVFREDDTMDGYGTSDGDITTTGGRMVHLAADARSLVSDVSGSKTKKGYTSLPDESKLSGAMDLEAGTPQPAPTGFSPGNLFFFINVGFLQSLFDIDTLSVHSRVMASVLPYAMIKEIAVNRAAADLSSDASISSIRSRPDFYGPFWICASLSFLLFAASNSAAYISGRLIETDFLSLVVAFSMFYGYLSIVPAIASALLMFIGGTKERESITLKQLISVYGYSFAVVLPVSLLCIIPSAALRWLWATLGFLVSLTFTLFNFKADLSDAVPQCKLGLLGLFVVAQLTFYASLPLYFFGY